MHRVSTVSAGVEKFRIMVYNFAKNKKYVGKTVEVLVDKILKLSFRKSESLALGKYKYLAHTRTQKKVVFFSNKKIPVGSFQKIKITKAKAFGLEGKKMS